jgi:hypothetical protein
MKMATRLVQERSGQHSRGAAAVDSKLHEIAGHATLEDIAARAKLRDLHPWARERETAGLVDDLGGTGIGEL